MSAVFLILARAAADSLFRFQGDGENDVGMFNAAGYSVSMGNAMDAPRKAAAYSTGTNNEGGVGQFLDRIFRVSTSPLKSLSRRLDE